MTELSQTRMLFESQVSAAFIKGNVFPNVVGLSKAGFNAAEFVSLPSMDIAELPILMDAGLRRRIRVLNGCDQIGRASCRERVFRTV